MKGEGLLKLKDTVGRRKKCYKLSMNKIRLEIKSILNDQTAVTIWNSLPIAIVE